MPKCLAEILIVVVPGYGEDRAAAAQKLLERVLHVANGFAEPVRAGELTENVAGHEQDVDFFLAAIAGHPLDGPPQIVGAVDAAEAVAEVPVRGVQQLHVSLLSQAESRRAEASWSLAGLFEPDQQVAGFDQRARLD